MSYAKYMYILCLSSAEIWWDFRILLLGNFISSWNFSVFYIVKVRESHILQYLALENF